MPQNQSYQLIALAALCDAADQLLKPLSEMDPIATASHFETALRFLSDSINATSPAIVSQRDRARNLAADIGDALDVMSEMKKVQS